ncbi:MAG TPA: V-type ATPase 116kDa subunit family protein [Polyangiales bacterium]|nr:V-type ATPase 116kDa subunit family protein [Polyangiales bacterium]
MSRIRLLGPRNQLQAVLARVQDLGLVHLVEPPETEALSRLGLTVEQQRHVKRVRKVGADVDRAIELLGERPSSPKAVKDLSLSQAGLIAGRCRRQLESLTERRQLLEEERALILKFRPFFSTFRRIADSGLDLDGIRVFYLVLREDGEQELRRMRVALREAIGDGFELLSQPSESGESAMLLAVPSANAKKAELLLSETGVQALSLPEQFEEGSVVATVQRMQDRLLELPAELAAVEEERRQIAKERGRDLARIQAGVHDHLAKIEAMGQALVTPRAFILEGWVPSAALPELENRLEKSFGNQIETETVSSAEWAGDTVPVVLHNPRLFRPFESITRMMPLPKYGTVDPTPFVAIFFPMFFGVVLGDVGYGAMLGIISLILRIRSPAGGKLRSVSEIGLACALFAIIFGFLYGELFGDLGHRIGLHPIIFNREEAFFPFLGFAVALGIVHIVVGLLLGAVKLFRGDKRRAVGKGIAALMVVLIALALMAAFEMLPQRFFTPLVISVLVAFPLLIIAEGVLAPVELISTLGNVLSYARIMAVGTASVMMAIVANRMAGAFGSVVVGALFALLFHLINFVLGVFSPTIHMLRLHYVEFFGKFYSPGGSQYRPFRHWSARDSAFAERSS